MIARNIILKEEDWVAILDSVRLALGSSELILSGDVPALISGLSGGGGDEFITRTIKSVVSDVLTIGDHAFDGCTALTEVSLPEAASAGTYAFSGCTTLREISLPKLLDIPSYMFQNCTSLTRIDLPLAEGVGALSFRACTSLESVSFPKAKTVGSQSFQNSSKLKRAEFFEAVKINNLSLAQTKLDTLVLRSSEASTLLATNAFSGTPIAAGTGYIYVPSDKLSEYKSATNWSAYAEVFRAIEDYPEVISGGEANG